MGALAINCLFLSPCNAGDWLFTFGSKTFGGGALRLGTFSQQLSHPMDPPVSSTGAECFLFDSILCLFASRTRWSNILFPVFSLGGDGKEKRPIAMWKS